MLGLVDDDLYYWEYYDFMDIGKYVIYLYYVYIMTHMFNI